MAVDTGRSAAPAAGGATRSARGRGRAATSNDKAPGTLRRAVDRHWYAWTMVAPVVLVIGVIIGYPLARGVYLSLTNATEANVARDIGVNHIPATYDFIGLDNYAAILTDERLLGPAGVDAGVDRVLRRRHLHPRPDAGRHAEPADEGPLLLPHRDDRALGRARVRLGLRLADALQREVRHPQQDPRRRRHRRRPLAERPDLGQDRGHRRQRVARRALHDRGDARRPAGHPRRAVRGRRDGRRGPLAAFHATSRCPASGR